MTVQAVTERLDRRGALFREREELKRACALIVQCGYWRRKQELEDAEEAAKRW